MMRRVVAFLSELRDRRLFQIVVSYVAGGWLVLQVISQLVQHGLLPNLAYLLAFIWYVGAIPAVAVLAWNHGERGVQKAPLSEIVTISLVLVGTILVTGSALSNHFATRAHTAALTRDQGLDVKRVAVLYFKDLTQGGEQQYLADALTEDLISELTAVRTLDVVSQNGVALFRDSDLPHDSIAMLLEAGTLVDGSVEQVGDRVRINLRLVDGGSGAEFRRVGFERPTEEVFALRDELARETARFLREWLGSEIRLRELARATESTSAWALYQRAEKLRKDAEALEGEGDHEGMTSLFDQADQLLSSSEAQDSGWVEPTVLRGFIAYRRARLAHGQQEIALWTERGMAHAERAVQRAPRHARALELRGSLQYWQWLQRMTPDPAEHALLLKRARADLERAVELDPTLASAHSTLSHLYYTDDTASAVLAARKAYEEDAYLDVANEVLWRLTLGSYDLAQFTQAKRWCNEGSRRFGGDYRFTYCQILLMSAPGGEPQIDRAWELLARLDSLAPHSRRAYWKARGQFVVGGVIARAGLPDSARTTMARARESITHEVDPTGELLLIEGYVRTIAGDTDEAIALLRHYAATNPRYSFEHHWNWQDLRSHPGFRDLRRAQ